MATMAMEGVMATQWQQDGDGQRYRKGNKWSNSGAMAMTAMDGAMAMSMATVMGGTMATAMESAMATWQQQRRWMSQP